MAGFHEIIGHDDVVNHYNSTVMANEYKKIYTIK